ncbi:MAG TPA: metallophosphoesterase family protein [Ktedonobacterales bacterium]|nr:metallophosphoesterase family protein [Ktedonobacterales bacterium]
MRVALISDIHGNAFALDAVLADIQGQAVDRLLCLGDAIQGGAQPVETVHRLREIACPIIMGNADAWLLSGQETGTEPITSELETVRQWSLSRLSAEDRAFIADFVPTLRLPLTDNHALLCFHGSPASFDDILLPTTPYEAFLGYLEPYDARWYAGGHTHLQQVRRVGAGFFCNPGSVGRVYNNELPDGGEQRAPWAEYAILTAYGDAVSLEFRRVPLATEPLFAVLRASGHPFAEEVIREYAG